jgi:hypothetical protein
MTITGTIHIRRSAEPTVIRLTLQPEKDLVTTNVFNVLKLRPAEMVSSQHVDTFSLSCAMACLFAQPLCRSINGFCARFTYMVMLDLVERGDHRYDLDMARMSTNHILSIINADHPSEMSTKLLPPPPCLKDNVDSIDDGMLSLTLTDGTPDHPEWPIAYNPPHGTNTLRITRRTC